MSERSACQSATSAEAVVCTLFEGDYHFGVAALINSLVCNGFTGVIVAGYRGALPPWTNQLTPLDSTRYQVLPGTRVEFVHLETPIHFANLKAEFLQRVIGERSHGGDIWYFDPDIVISCPWEFFLRWIQHGICLCEDMNDFIPENHPMRLSWKELVLPLGWKLNGHRLSRYYNSGFIGLPFACGPFLDRWREALEIAVADGYDPRGWGKGGILNSFPIPDQDALNIAAMYTEYPLTTMGPAGMGFQHGQTAMHHAAGAVKPWRKNMLASAIQGVPPSGADKAYLANTAVPIQLYSSLGRARRRTECALGAALGRCYRRH